ncbi:MAG: PQQ-binding-like beta-propeller repeat protein, partial [Nonomuraea sp.]|nr:PQQ-binding-like beta-propeller repeat protein [Nonomuraea sp.]
ATLATFPTGGTVKTAPVVTGRFVYVASTHGNVYARPLVVSPG